MHLMQTRPSKYEHQGLINARPHTIHVQEWKDLGTPMLPRRITRSAAKAITHHGRYLGRDSSQDPEDTL
jgi:hypothetical protein